MKNILHSHLFLLQLLCMVTLMLVGGCEDDTDMRQPIVNEVRNYAAAPDDTVITSLNDGQWVVLIGKNLSGVTGVYFGSIRANVDQALFTDESLVVQVPAIPFDSVAREELNKITVVSGAGSTIFTIKITGAPLITRVRNYAAAPNDTTLNAILPGQTVNIIGFNLENVTNIEFQGIKADLSNIIFTDSSAIIKAPADFSSAGVARANKITYTTPIGTGTYYKPNFNDPLWILLTGGVGKEKTWVLDLDAGGRSKIFPAALAFVGEEWYWNRNCTPVPDGPCFNYFPDKTEPWMPQGKDYGTMTFKLKGDPLFGITVDQKGIGDKNGTFSGSYILDVDAKAITFSDDFVPLNMGWDQVWSKAYIFSISEDGMQLAFKHPTKAEYEIYNYISKEYHDSWGPPPVPPVNEGYNPKFAPGELADILTGGSGSARQWQLDVDGNPVNWSSPGSPDGWTQDKNSTFDWGWNASWDAAIQGAWIKFDQFNGQKNYTRYQNGTTTTGTFAVNESTNEITLTTNTLLVNPDSWMSPTTNTIKVIKAYPSDLHLKGLWFGTSYDAGKDEWLVFHYITL